MLKNYLLHLDLLTPINHIYYLMNNSIISETIQKELNLKEWQVNKIIDHAGWVHGCSIPERNMPTAPMPRPSGCTM